MKYILLYQPVMWFILVQTYLKNILAQNIQIVLKEQMLKQRQMLQQVFLNLLKLLWESILERIMKINIEEMAKMVRYDSKFALPVYDDNGKVERYNIFHASVLIRYSNDGKMYLYDIIDIKKETSNSLGD